MSMFLFNLFSFLLPPYFFFFLLLKKLLAGTAVNRHERDDLCPLDGWRKKRNCLECQVCAVVGIITAFNAPVESSFATEIEWQQQTFGPCRLSYGAVAGGLLSTPHALQGTHLFLLLSL